MKKIDSRTHLLSTAATRIYLGLCVSIGLTAFASQSVLAQTATTPLQGTTVNPLQDFQQQDNPDPFSERGSSQSNGIFDLIHRAVLGPSRGLDEYSTEQRDNLNTAAAEFRAKQQQLLQNPGQTTPAAVTPATVTPAMTSDK